MSKGRIFETRAGVKPSRSRQLWALVKSVLLTIYGLLIRIRVVGRERVALPIKSGFVVAANHLTGADSIVIQLALRTRVFFLAAAKWFHSRFVGFWMRNLCDTMPVAIGKGNENIPTLRRGVQMLREGAVLGVYPEGELNRRGDVDHLYDGTAWLAVRAQVPVLPVYVAGLKLGPEPNSKAGLNEAWEGFFSVVGNLLNRNIVVALGEPIAPPAEPPSSPEDLRREIRRINQRLQEEFSRLRKSVPSPLSHAIKGE